MIPYSRQNISQKDIKEVVKTLKSDFLTQGEKVPLFENTVSKYCGVKFSVACNSATSGLHLSCLALGLKTNDYLWTSPISFVASSNCGIYCGANVDFVDIDKDTFNISIPKLEEKLEIAYRFGKLPKIIVVVHMCGLPCDMRKIKYLSKKFKFKIIEDASHAMGAEYFNTKVGSCKFSDLTVFSFHPVKIITTGEGGMITTNDKKVFSKLIQLRTHGITNDKSFMQETPKDELWNYQQIALGFNYRMNDIEAALGISQMKKVDSFVQKRNKIAKFYENNLDDSLFVTQNVKKNIKSSFHLYSVRIVKNNNHKTQKNYFYYLQKNGIGVNLHYIPIYLQPFYQKLGFKRGYCPEAEKYFKEAISLPIYPGLKQKDVKKILDIIRKI